MDVEQQQDVDAAAAGIAAAIGEPARARMLYCLMDNRARTATELAVVAEVSPATASAHLNRLKEERLLKVAVQGRHRYYTLEGAGVANVLEGLSVLAGGPRRDFVPNTPSRLRTARTCYDHMAGVLGVSLHDRFATLGWISTDRRAGGCEVTPKGEEALAMLEIEAGKLRTLRRRFAFRCLDWSERRSHLGGALGAALLTQALKRRWVLQDPDGRALTITSAGKREMRARFGVEM